MTSSPGLSGRFFVTALPTIFHVMNGEFRQYRGSRDLNSFMVFIEEKKWEEIEPVSSWKVSFVSSPELSRDITVFIPQKPDSIPMSILSLFFKLSHFLKVMKLKMNVSARVLPYLCQLIVVLYFRSWTTLCWRSMDCQCGDLTLCLPLQRSFWAPLSACSWSAW